MVTVVYNGDNPLPVFHKLWLPGESRELTEKQAQQLDEQYPGWFEWERPEPEIEATDAAVALAEEHGIDLASITGTGTGGKIIKSDIEAVIADLEPEAEES